MILEYHSIKAPSISYISLHEEPLFLWLIWNLQEGTKLIIVMLLICSSNGNQEFRGGGDLRERLDRIRSPLRNSPDRRDARARHTSHGDSPRSLGKRIDRNVRKRRQFDGHSDYSGRMSDGTEDQIKDRRLASSEAKMQIDEQLREIHSEIKLLEEDKQQLQMYLEEKVSEADSLTFKIHDLEMQLSKEKEEGKRFSTKIKKFIKAHNRHSRLQDELKRSQAQLQKLGEQLDSDVGVGNEDDTKTKASSDDVKGGFTSPLNEGQLNSSPRRKRSCFSLEAQEASPQVGGRADMGKGKVEKPHRSSRNQEHFSNTKKSEADADTYNSRWRSTHEEKSRKGSNLPTDTDSADKYKVTETGIILPSTGIAANAIDEDVEVAETDERFHVLLNGANGSEERIKTLRLPFLPLPPPIPQNAYMQYKGDDENVDVDGVDEETAEVDIV
ncbi:zinc finger CCCH domain-containing protein 13-like isoform X1 [Salvia splendens]|uniref:zinc finger CCCH domain-containing protein 13-like isoform X1 n=1 Tax=Salvia splendens TaxID=180675 RepID=UPI001C26D3CD|nr:zinc finger CCCH domain-containing protein 13-like isoform X1 [Salvia splendens]XP_041992477.1 zinc finger CCCH domain-containing protein 13-like isoform X1 [Salvia splendens]